MPTAARLRHLLPRTCVLLRTFCPYGVTNRLLFTLSVPSTTLFNRPNATWSPGGASGGGDPQTLALKRAQNWLGSVAVPVGVLGQKSPTAMLYATQVGGQLELVALQAGKRREGLGPRCTTCRPPATVTLAPLGSSFLSSARSWPS